MLGVSSFNWVKLVKDADLPANAKYLALYLSTFMNSDNAMAWPSLRRIEHETGLSRPTVIKYLKVLEDTEWLLAKRSSVRITTSGGYQDVNEYLVSVPQRVVKEIAHLSQGGKTDTPRWLNSEPKVVKELNRNNNIITSNNKRGRFAPPSLQEVTQYCQQRGNSVNPETFVDFYTSKDWMVGKTKMKDWKASVRTWEKRETAEKKKEVDWDTLAKANARPGESMADFKKRWRRK